MLTRRSWGPAQYTPELQDHVYLWLAYYHFVRCHESLRIKLEQPVLRKGAAKTDRISPQDASDEGRSSLQALVNAADDELPAAIGEARGR